MPTALPIVSRRRLILAGAALALLGGTVATACGTTPSVKDVDALLGQLERARSDAALAGLAAAAAPTITSAAAAPTGLAAALTVVATQRNAHAKALSEEITRISGEAPPAPSTTANSTSSTTANSTSSTTSASPSAPPPKPPTAADVVAALGQSADAASLSATQQSGYRAGLLGSIAAACTAAASVALVDSGQSS